MWVGWNRQRPVYYRNLKNLRLLKIYFIAIASEKIESQVLSPSGGEYTAQVAELMLSMLDGHPVFSPQ